MTINQAFILGVIQGLTELLPISSSAHLNLIPWICKWTVTKSFDVALHFGTLIAIGSYFYKDWINLVKNNPKMFKYILYATIPGGIIGFLLDNWVGDTFINNPLLIATMLIIMGIILYKVDNKSPSKTEYEDLSFKQTFIIGLSQALAFVPGVSRSGITMTTGRLMGLTRETSAWFSFMLSAPIVLAASIYKAKDFVLDIPFIVGIITSSIVGIIVIKFLLNYLKRSNFKSFAVYRIIIGIVVIIIYFLT